MKTKKDTKDLLLEITFDEVFTYGYQGASVLKILEKAGLNKGSLYHYFKNKKEMVLTAIDIKSKEIFGREFELIVNGELPYLENFEKMLIKSYDLISKRGCPLANLIQEMSNHDKDFEVLLKNKYDGLRNMIENIIKKAIENNELYATDTKDLSLFILSFIEGNILTAKAFKDKNIYEKNIKYLFNHLKSLSI
ncbi:TetR/AcrR family transcriptional regulator [Aliarcobacter butzleri]|uniref:TetR/AcrR family transcriptional regulator n=1 Tax=Aliarcobacter butzleri TaxID=28197 RepID=A0AAW7Q7C2_9BACT|nr:TetR/AcrR family transcriptional regulator [Aliarcobacter butzleri]MDN5114986.1 TetR/AcrR family transcriptional regulator [Aliarcobacter butzleri]